MSELVSGCCGAAMTGLMADYGICPDCKEHCEVVDLEEDEIDISDTAREFIDMVSKGDKKLAENITQIYEAGYVRGERAGIKWGKEMASNMFKKMREEIKCV